MAWHSDGDMSLAEQTTIASLSLGATRKFVFGISVPKKKLKCCCNRQLIVMRVSLNSTGSMRL
jgi:alkylated DNA repair dioxygenase AlkB